MCRVRAVAVRGAHPRRPEGRVRAVRKAWPAAAAVSRASGRLTMSPGGGAAIWAARRDERGQPTAAGHAGNSSSGRALAAGIRARRHSSSLGARRPFEVGRNLRWAALMGSPLWPRRH
ncbi:unnamed protein product [Urochloa humidicola]